MLWPYMPDKCDALLAQLGLPPVVAKEGEDRWPATWGGLAAGTRTAPGQPLFPRLDDAAQAEILARLGATEEPAAPPAPSAKTSQKGAPKKAPASARAHEGPIVYDDFAKVELRLGLVLAADRVDKSDKLLKLSVDLGEKAPRQILAGISEHYAAEALVGKKVVVVANLAPRKMMGLESQGMVLAASEGDTLGVLTVEKDLPPGSRVS
jgi:methionyl-tRNA synthetase